MKSGGRSSLLPVKSKREVKRFIMKRLITGISILAFAILVFGVGQSSAQWGGIWGNPDYRDGR